MPDSVAVSDRCRFRSLGLRLRRGLSFGLRSTGRVVHVRGAGPRRKRNLRRPFRERGCGRVVRLNFARQTVGTANRSSSNFFKYASTLEKYRRQTPIARGRCARRRRIACAADRRRRARGPAFGRLRRYGSRFGRASDRALADDRRARPATGSADLRPWSWDAGPLPKRRTGSTRSARVPMWPHYSGLRWRRCRTKSAGPSI